MRKHHRHRRRPTGIRLVVLLICIAAIYASILLGIQVIGNRLEKQEVMEPFGSLEGRFDSDRLTFSYGGRTWTYRERALTNMLIMGVNWADEGQSGSSARDGGQADFLLLVTFDRENQTISALQIDRDTMTTVKSGDDTGQRMGRICLSYAYGNADTERCENTVGAVSSLLGGIPIDSYVSLDTESIAVLNDALGGMTVTLEDDFTQWDPAMAQGSTLTLQGKQAEYYVRGCTGAGEDVNLSRMKRQLVFVQAVSDQIIRRMNQDPNSIGALVERLSDHMMIDLDQSELIHTVYESRAYQQGEPQSLAGSYRVGEDGFMDFWADEDALGRLLTHTFFE